MVNKNNHSEKAENMEQVIVLFYDQIYKFCYWKTHSAIDALPDEQQEILLLRYGQDLQIGEIAEILGLSRFQVMYRIRNAFHQLKKTLKEESP